VIRSDNYVAVRVNCKVDASAGDALTALLLGALGEDGIEALLGADDEAGDLRAILMRSQDDFADASGNRPG
jgi:hypothetical protein